MSVPSPLKFSSPRQCDLRRVHRGNSCALPQRASAAHSAALVAMEFESTCTLPCLRRREVSTAEVEQPYITQMAQALHTVQVLSEFPRSSNSSSSHSHRIFAPGRAWTLSSSANVQGCLEGYPKHQSSERPWDRGRNSVCEGQSCQNSVGYTNGQLGPGMSRLGSRVTAPAVAVAVE